MGFANKIAEKKTVENFQISIDPYVIVTRGNVSKRTPVSSGRDPVWGSGAGAVLEFPVEAPVSERLRMRAMDQDELTEDDFLGDATLDVVAALENVKTFIFIKMWYGEKRIPTGFHGLLGQTVQRGNRRDPSQPGLAPGVAGSGRLQGIGGEELFEVTFSNGKVPRFELICFDILFRGRCCACTFTPARCPTPSWGSQTSRFDSSCPTTASKGTRTRSFTRCRRPRRGRRRFSRFVFFKKEGQRGYKYHAILQEGFTLLSGAVDGARLCAEVLNAHCDEVMGRTSVRVVEIDAAEEK